MRHDGTDSRRVRGRKKMKNIHAGGSSLPRLLVNVAFVAALGVMAWAAVTRVPYLSAQFEELAGAFQTSGGGGGTGGIGGVGKKIGGMWKGVGNVAPFH